MKRLLLIGLSSGLIAACGLTQEKKVEEVVQEVKTCTYSYDPASVEILWKAYKYTEKTGVNGAFKEFELTGAKAVFVDSSFDTGNIDIEKIESKISYMLMQYPQDIALPKSINNKYLSYSLLKFKLMK